MILGIGTDIVDIRRIKRIINNYGDNFIKRCFSDKEIQKSNYKLNKYNFYAKRFAAKEACSKALSTGLRNGIFWKDIEILNNALGKPFIILHNRALFKLNELSSIESKIEISMSDEKNYAIANVIIFEK